MSSKLGKILVIVGGILFCGGAAIYFASSPAERSSSQTQTDKTGSPSKRGKPVFSSAAAGPIRLSFKKGDRIGYDVDIRTTYAVMSGQELLAPEGGGVNLASGNGRIREVSGQFFGHVLSERIVDDVKTWKVEALMRNVQAEELESALTELEEGLALPILFELNEKGHLTGIAGNPETSVGVHNLWQGFLQSIEFSLSTDNPSAKEWQSSQTDTTGVYSAKYTRIDQLDQARLQRERTHYTKVHKAQGMRPQSGSMSQVSAEIIHSHAVAVWTPNQKWFSELRTREHMKLRLQGRVLAEADSTLTMKQTDPNQVPLALWSRPLEESKFHWRRAEQLALLEAKLPFSDRAPIPGLAEKSLEDVLQAVHAFLDLKPQSDFDNAINLLVQYLRLNPENAYAVLDEIRNGDLPDEVVSLSILGLELAGGEIAHNVLVEAANDNDLSTLNRMRAAGSLGDVPDPDRAVVDSLLELAQSDPGREGDEKVQHSATLGLGVLAGNEKLDKESRQLAQETLKDDLADSTEVEEISLLLESIGNSHDPVFEEEVFAMLEHESPLIKVSAYDNLDRIGALPSGGELLERFRKEPNSLVKREMARILGKHDHFKSTDVDVAISWLETYPEPTVRRLLIEVTGKAVASHPEAKASLAAHFRVEEEPELLVLIGTYLSAKDLR